MIDANAKIREYLLTDVPLVNLVGARIYAGRDVPPEGYQPQDGAAITFRLRGGSPDYDDALLTPSVQFKCYAATEIDAMTCYRALYDALHNGTGATVLHGESEILGQSLEEPNTQWPFVLSYFQIMLRQ